jgi:hypothetical protein
VINGLMCRPESSPSSRSNMSPLKLFGKVHVEDSSIQLRECVANYDQSIIVRICVGT